MAYRTNDSLALDSASTPSWSPGVVSDNEENDLQATENLTMVRMSDYVTWFYKIDPFVVLYSTVIITILGIIGNSFSIGVLLSSLKFRRSSTVQFLIALAVTDSFYLIGELLFATSFTDYNGMNISSITFVNTSDIACKLVVWLRYSSKMMSAWITVAISLERLLAIAVPTKFTTLSTLNRARVLIVILCITCVPLTSYPLWSLGSRSSPIGMRRCLVLDDNFNSYIAWMKSTNIVGSLLVPSTLIIIFTSIFFIFLGRSRMKPRQSTNAERGDHKPQQSPEKRRLTTMLIAVCVTTILLQLPFIVVYMVRNRMNLSVNDHEARVQVNLALTLTQILSTLNYAINFLIYCVSGPMFRQRVFELISGSCRSRWCTDRVDANNSGRQTSMLSTTAVPDLSTTRTKQTDEPTMSS